MNDFYAMQRANGDWFALDDHGRFRVPLFRSSRDAMQARQRNSEMLLFKPVALNARALKEILPNDDGNNVDFWLADDPSVSLRRGRLIEHAQLGRLVHESIELRSEPGH